MRPETQKLTVIYSEGEDGYVIAECPELPGCVSQGANHKEAEKNIFDAIQSVLQVKIEAKDAEIAGLKQEVERLKLQSEHADCWWDDDADFESPEEYADERSLKMGDEFTLRAAAYWDEKYRVTSVRNQETDEGEYDCEQISQRRETFPSWFELKAENAALREKVAALEKIKEHVKFAEHKIDQHLQGQYNYPPYRALGAALASTRNALLLLDRSTP